MDIKIKRISAFYSVRIEEGQTTIDLGLMNRAELKAFCQELRSVADKWSPEDTTNAR